jgi:hypothetical protein
MIEPKEVSDSFKREREALCDGGSREARGSVKREIDGHMV